VTELLVAALWSGLIFALLVRAFRQYRSFPSLAPVCGEELAPQVAIVVPARNEGRNIARCLRSLLEQDYPGERYDIVVVDDASTDGTAGVVESFRQSSGRVHSLRAETLPDGWTGKTHACWLGACAPQAARAEWLCFLDADTAAQPLFLSSAMAHARLRGKDMYSVCPRQEIATLWERIFFPVGFLMIAFFQNLRSSNDPGSPEAAANGQCLLVRREAYANSRGHAAVAGEVCEDSALAMHLKRCGYAFEILSGERLIRTRLYGNLAGLWEGLAKNIVESLGGRLHAIAAIFLAAVLTLGTIAVPLWTWHVAMLGPLGAAAFALSCFASAALFATYVRAAGYFETPAWYALLFPCGYAIGIGIAIAGLAGEIRGAVAWKGRTIYRQPPARARFHNILRVAERIRWTWVRR